MEPWWNPRTLPQGRPGRPRSLSGLIDPKAFSWGNKNNNPLVFFVEAKQNTAITPIAFGAIWGKIKKTPAPGLLQELHLQVPPVSRQRPPRPRVSAAFSCVQLRLSKALGPAKGKRITPGLAVDPGLSRTPNFDILIGGVSNSFECLEVYESWVNMTSSVAQVLLFFSTFELNPPN